MTQKVLKFERQPNGWYKSRQMELCGSMVLEYFDVEEFFDLHFSTAKPRDDNEYYELEADGMTWYLMEGPDKGGTPTTSEMDVWLTERFAGKRVYAWAMD